MKKPPSRILRILLPLVFFALGIGGMATLIKNRPKAEQGKAEALTIPVSIITVASQAIQVKIPIAGITRPEKQVMLQPQVSGEIIWVSKRLQKGTLFEEGETILAIDPTDYELAVEQAKAAVKQAEVSLVIEKSRGKVAKKEWAALGLKKGSRSSLAMRQPQLELAKSNLAAAKASLKSARVRLKRTKINAPFNGIVISEKVDMGQVVGPGAQLITFIGADRSVLEAQVKLSDLNWIEFPAEDQPGSLVELSDNHNANVIGVGGKLDDTARTATLLIGVEAPKKQAANRLFANSWIGGDVLGKTLDDVMTIPRYAVTDKKTVWTASLENTLKEKTINWIWADDEYVYVPKDGNDLIPGDNIIVSPLNTPVEGLSVSPIDAEATK